LRLSPAYDLVNTSTYTFDREAALAIGGRKRQFEELNRATLVKLGTDIGLPEPAVQRALNDLAARIARAKTLRFPDHLGADDFRALYLGVVQENTQRIFA
jgi:serine/threonine-protein kinase HipA